MAKRRKNVVPVVRLTARVSEGTRVVPMPLNRALELLQRQENRRPQKKINNVWSLDESEPFIFTGSELIKKPNDSINPGPNNREDKDAESVGESKPSED